MKRTTTKMIESAIADLNHAAGIDADGTGRKDGRPVPGAYCWERHIGGLFLGQVLDETGRVELFGGSHKDFIGFAAGEVMEQVRNEARRVAARRGA